MDRPASPRRPGAGRPFDLDDLLLQPLPAITPELIDRCLEVAREFDRELGERLASQRARNPQEFERTLKQGTVGRRLLAMAQLKRQDPELYKIKLAELTQAMQVNRVALELREAASKGNQAEAKRLEVQLRSLLQMQLLMQLASRKEYVCRLEQHIQAVREETDHQAKNFQATVDDRLRQVLAVALRERASAEGPPSAEGAGRADALDAEKPSEP